jgi:tryptophan synthase beta subunit
MAALQELDRTYLAARRDKSFRAELDSYLRD